MSELKRPDKEIIYCNNCGNETTMEDSVPLAVPIEESETDYSEELKKELGEVIPPDPDTKKRVCKGCIDNPESKFPKFSDFLNNYNENETSF